MEFELLDKIVLIGLAVYLGIKALDAIADGALEPMDWEIKHIKANKRAQEASDEWEFEQMQNRDTRWNYDYFDSN